MGEDTTSAWPELLQARHAKAGPGSGIAWSRERRRVLGLAGAGVLGIATVDAYCLATRRYEVGLFVSNVWVLVAFLTALFALVFGRAHPLLVREYLHQERIRRWYLQDELQSEGRTPGERCAGCGAACAGFCEGPR